MTGIDFFVFLATSPAAPFGTGIMTLAVLGLAGLALSPIGRHRMKAAAPLGGQGGAVAAPAPAPASASDIADPVWGDSREALRRVQEIGDFGYWSVDIDTGETEWSDPVYRIYGVTPAEVRPSLERMLADIDSLDRRCFAAKLRDAVKHGTPFAVDMRLRRADGDAAEVRAVGRPAFREDGSAHRIYGILQDVTPLKRPDGKATESPVANNAGGMRSEFLAHMSHELRTPMNAILGYIQILKMEAAPRLEARHQAYLDDVVTAGQHLANLIDDVLEFSKLEAGQIDVKTEPVDSVALLREAESTLALQARDADIALDIRTDADLPPIRADHTRLLQALLNLGSNAIKYNTAGGSVWIGAEENEKGTLRFRVADTGPGIPAERQDELFQPFNRLGMERTGIPGTGIGLVITKRLVEAMNGRLTIENRPGDGTTVFLEMPMAGAPTPAPAPAPAVAGPVGTVQSRAPAPPAPQGDSILYIADDPRTLRLMNRVRPHLGPVRIASARTGGEGLALARAHPPDLIIVDLDTLDPSGQELLARLKRDARTAHVPVASLLGRDATGRGASAAAGFDAHLTKPLESDRFIDLVRAFMVDRGGERRAS